MSDSTALPEPTDEQRRQARRWGRIATVVVIVLLAIGAGRTMVNRMANARSLQTVVAESTVQYVRVTKVRAANAGGEKLALPGTLQGFVQAPVFLWAYDHRLFTIAADNVFALVGLFLLSEFVYYWFHRCSHEVRWMWASHCVHHSSTHLNLSAAYRLGWTDLISGDWLFFLLPMFLGFQPLVVVAMMGANLSFQFFLHTEAIRSLGPLEWVLNTPAHHRVHHASNAQCLDKNYGGVLIIYDRVFGTFARAPADEPLRYGLLAKAPTYNPVRILFREWLDIARDLLHARSPAAVWRAVSGRP